MTNNLLSALFFIFAALCGYLYYFGQPAKHLLASEVLFNQNLVAFLGLASFGAALALFRYRP